MEGNRELILYQPGPFLLDTDGEEYRAAPFRHTAWAERKDRGGEEDLVADTQIGEWDAIFRIRWLPSLHEITTDWWIFEAMPYSNPTLLAQGTPILAQGVSIASDREGRIWDVEYINEVARPRRRWLNLYCVAREGITTQGAAVA